MPGKKILLIDGHGIAFRAFYAVPALNAPDGTPTNALVGFFNMFAKVLHDRHPDEVFTAFDMKGPTFRHLLRPDYKATRKPTPEEFKRQVPLLHQLLPLLGVRIMERQTVEADDLLGSAAVQFAERGDDVIILTSDKDIMQVLRPHVTIIRPGKGVSSFDEYTVASFSEKYGFAPELMVDYLALMGDAVDNIAGVPGVGEKRATELISAYGTIENIIAHADELKPAMKKKITENGELAIANRQMTRLKCDEDLSEFTDAPAEADYPAFGALCAKLGMKKAASSFKPPKKAEKASAKKEPAGAAVPEAPKRAVPELLGEIALDAILQAPRLALDVEKANGKISAAAPEDRGAYAVVLAAPDGSWWRGTVADLAPEMEKLLSRKVICADVKNFCSLMPAPALGGLWDVSTAWYLLHPDLEPYDAEKQLGFPCSPERAVSLFSEAKELERAVDDQNMTSVLKDIDMPLIPALVNMERRGIKLDRGKMQTLSTELDARLAEITRKIYESAGSEINLNSPKQIGVLLFETLGLPIIKKTKTGYSTDVSVLEELSAICGSRCDIPAQLLEYRELQKMASGFVQPLMSAAGDDGIIHSTFEALTTGTGRLSSRDPNMQNLPAYSGWGARIRECLVPAREGNCFVAADYSQIELRVLAHLSGDPRLIEIFNSDRDIHTETAAMVFGLPAQAVTKELRRSAKAVSFGLIYGMSAFGLASRLSCDRKAASEIMEAYFAALPGVKEYITGSQKRSLEQGYSETLYGRRRAMDEITTGSMTKDHQKRVAINAPIQGTAADITKIAMKCVAQRFAGSGVHMVLQVHDSIVCECPEDAAEATARALAETMENAVKLSVPLRTEQSHGKTLATV